MSELRDEPVLWQGSPDRFLMVRNFGLALLGMSLFTYWLGTWAIPPWDQAICGILPEYRCRPMWVTSRIALIPFSLVTLSGLGFFVFWLTGYHRIHYLISYDAVTLRIEGVTSRTKRVELKQITALSKGSALSFFLGTQEKMRFQALRPEQIYAAKRAINLAERSAFSSTPTTIAPVAEVTEPPKFNEISVPQLVTVDSGPSVLQTSTEAKRLASHAASTEEIELWQGKPLPGPILCPRDFGFGLMFSALIAFLSLILGLVSITHPAEEMGFVWLMLLASTASFFYFLYRPKQQRRQTSYRLTNLRAIIESRNNSGMIDQEVFAVSAQSPAELVYTYPYDVVVGYRVGEGRGGRFLVPAAFENISDGPQVLETLRKIKAGTL